MTSHIAEPPPLPPGQRRRAALFPLHYGRTPKVDLDAWDLRIGGATASGEALRLRYEQLMALPRTTITTDHHCVAKVTVQGVTWGGIPAREVLALAPPAAHVEHVLLSAEYGYSANVRVEDLFSPRSLFVTHLDGEPLTPDHGWPLRLVLPHLYGFKGPKWVRAVDYLEHPQRGFWEQRGYHFGGDVWREERYAYQE